MSQICVFTWVPYHHHKGLVVKMKSYKEDMKHTPVRCSHHFSSHFFPPMAGWSKDTCLKYMLIVNCVSVAVAATPGKLHLPAFRKELGTSLWAESMDVHVSDTRGRWILWNTQNRIVEWHVSQDLRSYFLSKFRPVPLFALFFGRSLCPVHFSILLGHSLFI